jgi:hypothetical protein
VLFADETAVFTTVTTKFTAVTTAVTSAAATSELSFFYEMVTALRRC